MGIPVGDLTTVEAMGGAMLPVGKHTVRIETAEEGESSGGHPQVEFQFAAINGTGEIRDWIVFAPAKKAGDVPFALKKARAILDAAGVEPPSDGDFPTDRLPGKIIEIIVGEEPDNREPGKTRRRVQAYDQANVSGDLPGDSGGTDDDIPF